MLLTQPAPAGVDRCGRPMHRGLAKGAKPLPQTPLVEGWETVREETIRSSRRAGQRHRGKIHITWKRRKWSEPFGTAGTSDTWVLNTESLTEKICTSLTTSLTNKFTEMQFFFHFLEESEMPKKKSKKTGTPCTCCASYFSESLSSVEDIIY